MLNKIVSKTYRIQNRNGGKFKIFYLLYGRFWVLTWMHNKIFKFFGSIEFYTYRRAYFNHCGSVRIFKARLLTIPFPLLSRTQSENCSSFRFYRHGVVHSLLYVSSKIVCLNLSFEQRTLSPDKTFFACLLTWLMSKISRTETKCN